MPRIWLLALLAGCALNLGAQSASNPVPPNGQLPRSDSSSADRSNRQSQPGEAPHGETAAAKQGDESSSRATIIDLSPPLGDAQEHPNSQSVANPTDDVNELKPWDPHRAAKDVEVGDYYFMEKNYRGAESRYRDALVYQSNNAIANYRLAVALEKLGRGEEARDYYQAYLKILPHGPYAGDCRAALQKRDAKSGMPN